MTTTTVPAAAPDLGEAEQAYQALAPLIAEHSLPTPGYVDVRSRRTSVHLSTVDDLARWAAALDRAIVVVRLETNPDRLATWLDGEGLEFAGRRWDVYGPQIGRTP